MSIAYAASPGTEINTGCTAQLTLADQSQANGTDEVVVSDTLDNLAVTGMPATGNSYIGRKCIVNWDAHQYERVIVSDTAGTGTTRILGVNEPWATGKVPALNDTFDIAVEGTVDVENGTAGGGITVNAQTKEYTYTNDFNILSGGFVQHTQQLKFEINDSGSAAAQFSVASGGRWSVGYIQDGRIVNGSNAINENGIAAGADGEESFLISDGAIVSVFDFSILNPVFDLRWQVATGATQDKTKVYFKGFKSLLVSYNPILAYGIFEDFNVTGTENANNYYEITADTEIKNWTMVNCTGFDTLASDTSTETIRIDEVLWINTAPLVTVRANKSWLVIDPADSGWVVNPANQDALSFPVNTSNKLDKGYSVKATVQEADGTKLQNALVIVYENTQGQDLVVEEVTDVDGYAESYFVHENYVYATATTLTLTTYGGHSLQIDKWLYFPFVQDILSTEPVLGNFTIGPDSNMSQTTQATAITDGSGIAWSEPTNPTELFGFTLGSGTALVDMVLTFSPSGAVGTIREHSSGDSVSGELYLDVRNGTAIANGDTFSRTSGTAGTFSGTYTNDSKQPFSISINGNSKSYQVQHDYWAARTAEIPLNSIGEIACEWRRGQQERVLYKSGSDFFTERSNGKGIYIYGGGAGSVGYYTDDNGNTWTAPTSVTVQVTVLDDTTGSPIASTAHVYIADTATKTQIMSQAVNGSGVASIPYDYTVDVPIVGWAREFNIAGTDYVQKDFTGTIEASGFNLTVRLEPLT